MDSVYLDILQEWEDRVADPAVYEHLDVLFPEFHFRRMQQGAPKDHWASRLKLDLTIPRYKNAEKVVVYRSDMRFREQGDWERSVGIMDRYMADRGINNIYDAYRDVSSRLSLAMPQPGDEAVAAAVGKAARQSALVDTLTDYFCWNLEHNKSAKASAARTYLRKNRGFSDDLITRFCLGFAPDWNKVVRYITVDKRFPLEDLNEVCGVVNSENYTSVGKDHVIAIPYECGGVVKGYLFRRIDGRPDGPKYRASDGLDRKSVFFNMPADADPKDIVVVEGEFDAMRATSEGIPGVVAIGGSEISGERRRQVEDAFRRGARKITLCLDLDPVKDTGVPNVASRHAHLMRSVHTIKDVAPDFEEIYVALLPVPSDPEEYIRERGGEAFRRLLDSAVPYWKYLHDYFAGE